MRYLVILLLFLPFVGISQEETYYILNEKSFDSVFDTLETGNFNGTVNGVLILEDKNKKEIILDFQGSKATLNIIKDEHEVYDVSFKKYGGTTTSGKLKVCYETYAYANKFGVVLNNVEFSLNIIDGACTGVINGLIYNYVREKETEYLILRVEKSIELSNWQHLLSQRGEETIQELEKNRKEILVKPNSTLIFAISRLKN